MRHPHNVLVWRSGVLASVDCSASVMASGRGDAPADMVRVLAELQDSGTVYFQTSITRSRDRNGHKFGTDVELVLPPSFLQEHGGNFEEYVIFRTRTSAKPWIVQVGIFEERDAVEVKFAEGWEEFAADNCLKPGDSLIFVLQVPLPEFMVYVFHKLDSIACKARRQQDLPDSACDEEYSGQILGNRFSEIDTGDERNDLASQHGTDSSPNFEKRITTSVFRDKRIEVPVSFVRTHGMELQGDVGLQGIHQDSPVHMVKLRWRRQGPNERLYLEARRRNVFKEIGMRAGQQLRFTLTAASFFVVRRVSMR